jgi:hypothetical protein
MNNDDQKPTKVVNELEGLKNFLDENIPTLNESIPTLEESIPILDEAVDIQQDIKVSYDSSNSTETIEEQLIRTRHEQPSPTPKLVLDEIPELNEIPELDETPILTEVVLEDVSSTDEYVPYFVFISEPDDEQPSDDTESSTLEQQQQQIEAEANELRSDDERIDILLEKTWTKVEMLLMDNLPTQLSGTFLQLLNSQADENKLQIFRELSLLDDDMFQELSDALDDCSDNKSDEEIFQELTDDLNSSYNINTDDDEGF